MHSLTKHPYVRFALVGLLTYAADAAILAVTTVLFGLDPYSGRALSLTSAVVVAWYGNRLLTFSDRAARASRSAIAAEFGRSVLARAAGNSLNYGSYVALVAYSPPPANNEFVAQLIGALVAMVVNFNMMKRFVFSASRPSEPKIGDETA